MNLVGRFILAVSALLLPALCAAAVNVGDVPPDDLGFDFASQAAKISQYKGKVVIVTFWASWCAPCRKEMGVLDSVQKIAKDSLAIVAVNFNEDDRTWSAMKRQLAGAALRITRDPSESVTKAFDVDRIPHMLMIDRSGHVARIHHGYSEKSLDGILDEINELLAQK